MSNNGNVIDLSKHRKPSEPEPGSDTCHCDACNKTLLILAACSAAVMNLELRSGEFSLEEYGKAMDTVLQAYVGRMREEVTWPTIEEYEAAARAGEDILRQQARELDEIKRIVIPVAISKVEAYRQEILRLGGDPTTVRIRRRKPGGKSKIRRSGSADTE